MNVSIIAAVSINDAIGLNGKIPWRQSADLKRFRSLTDGHHVIMGRRTFESIGKPLVNRINVVVTANPEWEATGCYSMPTIHSGISLATLSGDTEVFLIGGHEIFRQGLFYASQIYLTRIHCIVEGDTYFPSIDWYQWELVWQENHDKDERNEYPYSFSTFQRQAW